MIRSTNLDQQEEFKPDLTPLLDIIFIVMVFLMLTANVAVHTLNVDIPKTDDSQVLSQPDQQVISIGILAGEQKWAVDGKAMSSWDLFTKTLLDQKQRHPDKPFVIAADKKADVESMLKVLAFLQRHQIAATNILMEES